MARHIATLVLLFVAMIFALVSALGILRSKNNLAALHCLGVTSVTLPILTIVAVLVDVGVGVSAVKTVSFIVILLLGGPITGHAIALTEHRRTPHR
ncbi:MAG TPA: monovalent cation/H(+) antiporter subunit G [Candidatus Baltobacteraceae bacterium]|jgi:multisubunit Na+/H+ antiporter MnhG subunit|nr:monovalent cation/H(+) antiporter subunit G [Candidatus Baltobacteraceae bacterium]